MAYTLNSSEFNTRNTMKLKMITFLAITTNAWSQIPEGLKVGGFLDTYYAYDFNSPQSHERSFTTQPVRHNEFNVNLAFLDVALKREKTRGRLALQYGNSVSKNYAGEPTQGTTSGPRDAQIFQEAFVGTKITDRTWIDMGIFLGNIGSESWISKDNMTYTRSLNLDYVPYYSSGLRLEHQLSNKEIIQIQLLNGWQNISENNQGKALGMQYKNVLSPSTTFTYNNFLGDEEVTSPNPRFRAYHNFILNYQQSQAWQYIATIDFGHQSQRENNGVDSWYAFTMTARHVLDERDSITFRGEYYNDRHRANVDTNSVNGFQVIGTSVNFDRKLDQNVLWRMELRGFYSKDKIYPQSTSNLSRLNGFFVSSLAFWF